MIELRPGQIRQTVVRIPHINPDAPEKERPAILLAEQPGGWWVTMGLTTLATFADGTPRIPVQDPHNPDVDSFFWGQTVNVTADSIRALRGWVSERDAETAVRLAERLTTDEVCRFWENFENPLLTNPPLHG